MPGVTIDKNLSSSEHIKQITKKANNVKWSCNRSKQASSSNQE